MRRRIGAVSPQSLHAPFPQPPLLYQQRGFCLRTCRVVYQVALARSVATLTIFASVKRPRSFGDVSGAASTPLPQLSASRLTAARTGFVPEPALRSIRQ